MNFQQKGIAIFRNLYFFIWTYPLRLYRVAKMFLQILWKAIRFQYGWKSFLEDFLSLLLLSADLFGIGEFYDAILLIIKRKTRGLTPKEKALVAYILPKTLPVTMIRIDNHANFLAKRGHFAYVSYFTINYYGTLRDDVFVHELIHIWQYMQFGSAYISKALFAQHSEEGYDYGGPDGLFKAYSASKPFLAFNFEQQGDILADYFRIIQQQQKLPKGLYVQRTKVYEYYINQIRELKMYRW